MSRDLDLYAAERRAGAVVLVAGVWLVRACVLAKFRAGDVARRVRRSS